MKILEINCLPTRHYIVDHKIRLDERHYSIISEELIFCRELRGKAQFYREKTNKRTLLSLTAILRIKEL